jgi:hypothetical protein
MSTPTPDQNDETTAALRVLAAIKPIKAQLIAMPAREHGAVAAYIASKVFLVLEHDGQKNLYFAVNSDKRALDYPNLSPLEDESDVRDWCLSASEVNEIAQSIEQWLVAPEYFVLSDDEVLKARLELAFREILWQFHTFEHPQMEPAGSWKSLQAALRFVVKNAVAQIEADRYDAEGIAALSLETFKRLSVALS